MAHRCAPEEVRWLATRKTALLQKFLLTLPGERLLREVSRAEVRIFVWERARGGTLGLRTMAEYERELWFELRAGCGREETATEPGLLRRLATLVAAKQPPALTEAEVETLLRELKGGARSLAAGLWLSAGRATEVGESLGRDVQVRGAAEEQELVWALRSKAGTQCWAEPIVRTLEGSSLRARCARLVRARAEETIPEEDLWKKADFQALRGALSAGQRTRSFRRGAAKDAAAAAERETKRIGKRAAQGILRHKSTRATPRYLT